MTSSSLSIPSFAKINWSLRILGRRPDGYHEVRTKLQTISLQDTLHFELTADGEVSIVCDDPAVPGDKHNLIVRAALALKESFGADSGVRVRVEKRIPTKAGLGGASSNAAIALLALSNLWRLPVSAHELLEIAGKLGADVPFFLFGGCAAATGTGKNISLLDENDERKTYLVVITPSVGISTAAAYAALNAPALTTQSVDPILSSSRGGTKNGNSQPWTTQDSLQNDFESVIFDMEPEIGRARKSLIQAGAAGALLAGSGSSVFGIFPSRNEQERAISEIKSEAGWRVFPCVTVSRNEYLRAFSALDVPFLRSFNSGS